MSKRVFTTIPGVVAALLPNVTCPACWPVYAGVSSSLGLGFLMQGRYFYPVVGVLLASSLFSLFHKAKTRYGLGPFLLGCMAATTILVGKLYSSSNYVLYIGAAILIAASLWNNWPKRKAVKLTDRADKPICPNCNINS
jgi:hypothetical protein